MGASNARRVRHPRHFGYPWVLMICTYVFGCPQVCAVDQCPQIVDVDLSSSAPLPCPRSLRARRPAFASRGVRWASSARGPDSSGHELMDLLPVRTVVSSPDAITAGSRGEERAATGQQSLAFVWVCTQDEQRDGLADPPVPRASRTTSAGCRTTVPVISLWSVNSRHAPPPRAAPGIACEPVRRCALGPLLAPSRATFHAPALHHRRSVAAPTTYRRNAARGCG